MKIFAVSAVDQQRHIRGLQGGSARRSTTRLPRKALGERAASAALHVLRLTFSRGKAAEYAIDAQWT
jgi:hypothetical protein